MILLLAVAAGLVAGMARAKIGGRVYCSPNLRLGWVLLVAVLPQFFAFHLPGISDLPDRIAAAILVSSQLLLFIFIWANRKLPGMYLLGLGLGLNLLVILLNGGLMPISPETLLHLNPQLDVEAWQISTRLGTSKDILLPVTETHLWFLSDRIVLPDWIPYRVAFSVGDILIATGTFWLLWAHGNIDLLQARFLHTTPALKRI